ncbi:MAG: hypothetical protein K2X66_13160, partial [Cyanobacteria bacterium]|nr:hypothetical protein [Cyanobacteriota bacterium]
FTPGAVGGYTKVANILGGKGVNVNTGATVNGITIGVESKGTFNNSGTIGNTANTLSTIVKTGDVNNNPTGTINGATVNIVSTGNVTNNNTIGNQGVTTDTSIFATGNMTGSGMTYGNYIYLATTNGNIGESRTVRFQTHANDRLTGIANNGSVWINQFGGGVHLVNQNSALNDWVLTTVNPGDITVDNTITANDVALNTTGSTINVLSNITGNNSVFLNAAAEGGIIGPGLISGNIVDLRALVGNIFANTNATNLTVNTGGNVNINESNGVNLGNSSAGGFFNLATGTDSPGIFDVSSGTGNIVLNGQVSGSNVNLFSAGSILSTTGTGNNIFSTGDSTLTAQGIIGNLANPINVTIGGNLGVTALSAVNGLSGVLRGTTRGNRLIVSNNVPGFVIFNGLLAGGRGQDANTLQTALNTGIASLYKDIHDVLNPGGSNNASTAASIIDLLKTQLGTQAEIINKMVQPQPFDLRLIEETNSDNEGPVDYRLIDSTSENTTPPGNGQTPASDLKILNPSAPEGSQNNIKPVEAPSPDLSNNAIDTTTQQIAQ